MVDKNKNKSKNSSSVSTVPTAAATGSSPSPSPSPLQRRKLQAIAVTTRLRSVLNSFSKNRSQLGLGPRVVGTLFGHRKGHVHFAIQKDPTSQPAFLIELATPLSGLVREMTSGLVRIALECDNKPKSSPSVPPVRPLEEAVWRTYCNRKKSGFATKRECGPQDWKVLKALEPISMGAGVLPPGHDEGKKKGEEEEEEKEEEEEGDVMYMRAKFERIVGSKDCEAFYMMNPDSNGAPELSIYLLRV